MFKNLFKRTIATPGTSAIVPEIMDTAVVLTERRRVPRPLPAPHVVEGDGGESDWALWLQATQPPAEESAPETLRDKDV